MRFLFFGLAGALAELDSLEYETCAPPRVLESTKAEDPLRLGPRFARSCVFCPAGPALRSLATPKPQKTKTTFQNRASSAAVLKWVRKDGEESSVCEVPPGHRKTITTTYGHVFRAYSASSGRLLVEHRVGHYLLDSGVTGQVPNSTESANEELRPEEKQGPDVTSEAISISFLNVAESSVHLHYESRRYGEMLISRLEPHVAHFEASYTDHIWTARLPDNTPVSKVKIADIVLRDCREELAPQQELFAVPVQIRANSSGNASRAVEGPAGQDRKAEQDRCISPWSTSCKPDLVI